MSKIKPHQSLVTWAFQYGEYVHYNHGHERFMVLARRFTNDPCTRDHTEYCLHAGGAGTFWVDESQLTLAEGA